MKKENNTYCNWCMRKINTNNSFYTFLKNKDFHNKCFEQMEEEVNKQADCEEACHGH
jgi:hypothetical protein